MNRYGRYCREPASRNARLPFTVYTPRFPCFCKFANKNVVFGPLSSSFTHLLSYTKKMCGSAAMPNLGLRCKMLLIWAEWQFWPTISIYDS